MRSQNTSPDDIDLVSLAGAVKKAFPKVLLGSLVVGAGTAGILMTMLPKYSAQAVIQVVSTDPNTMSTEKYDPAAVATHVTALKSTDLFTRMSKEFRFADIPEFNNSLPAQDLFTRTLQTIGLDKAKSSESDEDRVRRAYYSVLKVGQGRETRAINVEFTSADPEMSAAVANKLSQFYKESLTTRTLLSNDEEAKRLAPQVRRVRDDLAAAEAQVTKFRAETDQFTLTVGAQPSLQSAQVLGELTAELTRAATARAEAESRARAAKEQMALGTAEANPDVQKSQLIPRLSEQRIRIERQVSELATTLMPAHPRMRQVQGELSALQRQIKDEVRKLVDSLERDAKIAKEREDGLMKRIAATKTTTTTKAPQEAQLKNFEEAAKNKRTELERLEKAYNEALSKGNAPTSRVGVEIIQQAIPNPEKIFPKPVFFGPLMALASMLLGLAWTVTRELVAGPRGNSGGADGNGRFKLETTEPNLSPVQPLAAATQIAAPVMVVAPDVQAPTPVAALSDAAQSATVDGSAPRGRNIGITGVAAALLERTENQPGYRSLIAGDSESVDAANEAIVLAKALSKGGKQVVVVDWAGKNALANVVGGARGPGMAQLIEGEAAFEDVIQKLADTEAHFIPAGEANADSSSSFEADRANLVLDALDEAYDHILVYGDYSVARRLFEATQGRFDVGIVVSDTKRAHKPQQSTGFLGFEVADMEVFRVERTDGSIGSGRRGMTVRTPVASEARV
jgi:uncharacterized protein involved in exopolysaccharide biosynthesis